MKTGEAVLVVAGVGIGGYLLVQFLSHVNAAPPPPSGSIPPGPVPKAVIDMGPINLVTSLPGVGQAYKVLAPVAAHVTTPIINKINSTLGVHTNPAAPGLPGAPGGLDANGKPTFASKNPGWYERNIGGPISQGVTLTVHTIENFF